MAIEWNAMRDALVAIIFGSVGGAITGAFVAHRLAKRRDAENRRHLDEARKADRKHRFLDFLATWNGEVRTTSPLNFQTLYARKKDLLRAEYERIKSDFPDSVRGDFGELVKTLSSLTAEQLTGDEQGRKNWIAAIDPLIFFVEAN